MSQVRFSELSLPRQALIRLCQAINYGYIEKLHVRDREPLFSPAPGVLVDVKLDHDEGPRPEAALDDFEIAGEVRRLLLKLDGMNDGKIDKIEVRGGLPRRVVLYLQLPELLT
jgi:hypothetical protein